MTKQDLDIGKQVAKDLESRSPIQSRWMFNLISHIDTLQANLDSATYACNRLSMENDRLRFALEKIVSVEPAIVREVECLKQVQEWAQFALQGGSNAEAKETSS